MVYYQLKHTRKPFMWWSETIMGHKANTSEDDDDEYYDYD
jgi:hypothetical protein